MYMVPRDLGATWEFPLGYVQSYPPTYLIPVHAPSIPHFNYFVNINSLNIAINDTKTTVVRRSMSKHTLAPVFGTTEQERSLLDPSLYIGRFQDLDQDGKCMAEYVWIGGTGMLC